MLQSLHIQDFVIVDTAQIEFQPGFTVFSGETGAGKSILIDALSLILGARGDVNVIREGKEKADLSALFTPSEQVQQWLHEHDFDQEEQLLLRRVIDKQGRSRAYINGSPATQTQLRDIASFLVDIHGQHAHQSLLQATKQYELLDSQGGHTTLAQQVRQAWQHWQHCLRSVESAEQNAAALAAEHEHISWQLEELTQLNLQEDEWERISQEHSRLAHAQTLLDGSAKALNWLDNDDGSARQLLLQAKNTVQQLLVHDNHLQQVYDTLDSAHIACAEAVSDLNRYLADSELDPERLAQAEQRMAEIFHAARKHKCEPEDLLALQHSLSERLNELTASSNLEALHAATNEAEQLYQRYAAQLSEARLHTSAQLSQQVTQAMQSLSMEGGQFEVALTARTPSAQGNEHVEFLVAGHAGTRPAPLSRVASGGELARISLAFAVIASQAARVPTLIFDEVDTGIGGAVAEIVGRLLRQLGGKHQVLCVTHLPQVAAQGQHHFQVSKKRDAKETLSAIKTLDNNARIEEISRMLGGLHITATTRQHAQEMLDVNNK